MRRLGNVGLILIVGLGLLALTAAVSAEIRLTTTLLPASAESTESPDNMLEISAGGTDPITSTSSARLSFNLAGIPGSAAVTHATLRLVGTYAKENPQFVRIFADPQKDSIATWTATVGKSVFSASTEQLRQAVAGKIKAGQTLSLTLSSKSRLSNWRYYSIKNFAHTSSYKPRLIIEYTLDQPAAPTTERTSWKFFFDPAQFKIQPFKIKPFLADAAILSNPVFYSENIYLFAKPTSESTRLYALFSNGTKKWDKQIEVTPAAHALAGGNGILYSVGENRIVLYDLKQEGLVLKSGEIDDFKLSVSPTLGADGSLYFVRYGFIYGLNPEQEELWRYPAAPGAGKAEAVSRIVLSLDAQKIAYALARIDRQNQLTAINTADGSAGIYGFSAKYSDFHRPIIVAGPEKEYVIFSAYSVSDGILMGYSDGKFIWQQTGPVSRPTADMEGKRVFVVQNGKLQAYDKFNGQVVCTSARADLAATSNLVMDGDENIYFWNSGTFLGYTQNCEPLFEQKLPNLPEKLELLFAPDGTLFALSESLRLSLILPARPAFTLDQDNLRSQTIYSADTIRVAENLNLDDTANIILKAKDSISFGAGFTAQKGARLSCKVGF